MLRDRLAERPRVVAMAVAALWVLVVTVAIVSGLVGASLADGDSARADRMAAELRAVKDENKELSAMLGTVEAQKRRQARDKRRKAERQRDRERSRRGKARRERERRR
jgi:hypothetical protein